MKRCGSLVALLLFLTTLAHAPTARAAGQMTVACDRAEAEVGETVTWNLSFAGWDELPACGFFLYRDLELIAYTPPAPAFLYSCTPDAPGVYSLVVVARDGTGSVRQSGGDVDVSYAPPQIASVAASRPEITLGATATWTCEAVGARAYGFFVYRGETLLDFLVSENGASNVLSYVPAEPGTYTVQALAANDAGKAKMTSEPVVVTEAQSTPLALTNVAADSSEARVGEQIIWRATASGGGENVAFSFFLYRGDEILSFHPVGQSGIFHFAPTEPGVYKVSVHAGSGGESANLMSAAVTVSDSEGVRLTGVDASAWKVVLGGSIVWTANAQNASEDVAYAFALYRDDVFEEFIETGTRPTLDYTPDAPGEYAVVAFATDGAGAASAASANVKVVSAALSVDSVTVNALSVCVGEPIVWTVNASGADNLQYMYAIYCGAEQITPAVFSDENTFAYVPEEIGQTYSVSGLVLGGEQVADFVSESVRTFAVGTPHILSITPDRTDFRPGEAVTWTVEVANPEGVEGYSYTLYGNTVGIASETGWLMENTFLCAPTEPDEYALTVELQSDPWGFLNTAFVRFTVKQPVSLDFVAAQALSDIVVPALPEVPEWNTTPAPTIMQGVEIIAPKLNFPLATTRPPMAPEKPKSTPTPAPTINPNIFQPPAFHLP